MSESEREITDPSAFKNRSLGLQVVLAIVTFGFYVIYWWHITHKQLDDGTSADFNPTWRTVGMFIPIYNLIVMWRDSHDAEPVTGKDGVLIFVLFMVFAPAAWYLIQSGFNDLAEPQ
jgi:hypothetical protein